MVFLHYFQQSIYITMSRECFLGQMTIISVFRTHLCATDIHSLLRYRGVNRNQSPSSTNDVFIPRTRPRTDCSRDTSTALSSLGMNYLSLYDNTRRNLKQRWVILATENLLTTIVTHQFLVNTVLPYSRLLQL